MSSGRASGRASLCALLALVHSLGCGSSESPTAPTASPGTTTSGRTDVTLAGAGASVGGILFRPDTVDPRPAIVVIHGWQPAGTNGAEVVAARARRYADEGYVALAIAMRGWPPSGGADDCGLRQPDDVASAVAWLRQQPGVIGARVALVGFSQGGQVALLAALRDPTIRAVAAYYPVTDVGRWKLTTTNADIPSYVTAVCEPGGVAARSPLTRAADLSVPVLLVHGDADTRVPTEQSRLLADALQRAGRSPELLLIPGAQHGFTSEEEAAARPVVDRFLTGWLR
jgi:dipeptidyl aminopeptidase/acylaminoacyl peptidase